LTVEAEGRIDEECNETSMERLIGGLVVSRVDRTTWEVECKRII
jgi:hypothetical protein